MISEGAKGVNADGAWTGQDLPPSQGPGEEGELRGGVWRGSDASRAAVENMSDAVSDGVEAKIGDAEDPLRGLVDMLRQDAELGVGSRDGGT